MRERDQVVSEKRVVCVCACVYVRTLSGSKSWQKSGEHGAGSKVHQLQTRLKHNTHMAAAWLKG